MRFMRCGPPGAERPAVLDEKGQARDLSGLVNDVAPAFFQTLSALRASDVRSLPLVEPAARIGPCVSGTSKLVGIGLNYKAHAAESGYSIPTEPVVFLKSSTAISGPFDPVILPPAATAVDWEIELGVVIGSTANHVAPEKASEHIFGFCIVNDLSDRKLQMQNSAQWSSGKSFDTFAPIGPWLVRADSVPDVRNLSMRLSVNGRLRQNASTADMIFDVAKLISCISMRMTLLPGDIVCTGTPGGVAYGSVEPEYLQDGDHLVLEMDQLGHQEYTVRR